MSFYETIYDALRPAGGTPEETILLLQSRAAGRRLLAALAASCGPLLGVRAETPRSLALELAGPLLSAEGAARLMNDDEAATALLECVLAASGTFTKDSAGNLAAARELYRTLTELEMEEIGALTEPGKQADLQTLREAYAAKKQVENLWDRADLFKAALSPAAAPLRCRVVTLPGFRFTALEQKLIEQIAGGAPEIAALPVPAGATMPGMDLTGLPDADPFAGRGAGNTRIENCMSVHVEAERVFRDILEKGYSLDSCAVVYCNGSYAPLLYEAAARWDMPVSMSSGIPIEQTRLSGALKCVSELHRRFFDAELVRLLLTRFGCLSNARPYCDAATLEAAGIRSAGAGHLANILRRYRVGWGQKGAPKTNYIGAIDAYQEDLEKLDDAEQKTAYRVQSDIWRAWLEDLFVLAEERGHTPDAQCDAMLRFLASASKSTAAERAAVAAAEDAVRHVRGIPTGERLLDWLRHLLFERSILAENACPGKLFCLPLRQGYLACREHVYVLGLGRDVFSDQRESAVLLDGERASLSPRLALGGDAGREKRFRFLQMLLHHGGELILCYTGYDAQRQMKLEGARELETLRAIGCPETPRSYLPEDARSACDALLTHTHTICAPLPDPDPGQAAPLPLADAPDFADWLRNLEFSPSALETALKCPFSFYLTYALGIRADSLPAWRSDRWLDANVRGTLVHEVLEGYYKALRQQPAMPAADRKALVERLFAVSWEACRRRNPPPDSPADAAAERKLQMDMVRAAIDWTDAQSRTVAETEQPFGRKAAAVMLALDGKQIRLQGKVDRLDRRADGSYAVLDYKTSDPERFENEREYHLQHYLYAQAERVLSGGKITPAEAGYLLLGGLAKGETAPAYFPADAQDAENAAAVTGQLLDALSIEDVCLLARPWVPHEGTLALLSREERLNLLRDCGRYCVFKELCPLRTGEDPAPPDDTDDTDTDGENDTEDDTAKGGDGQ